MLKPILRVSVLFVLSILLLIQGSTSFEQENRIQSIQTQFSNQEAYRNLKLNPDFGKIPLYFIPNEGQVDETALFYAKASRYTLWLTKEGLVFDSTRRTKKESTNSKRLSPEDINNPENFKFERDVSRLIFVNANRNPEIIHEDVTEHKVNYFIGKNKSKWRTNIQTSRAVLYRELYPHIDLKVSGIEKQIEYDFVVRPGGQVSDIGFEYKDVEKTRIDKEGNLVIKTKFGELEHAKPVCYQVIEGERVEIQAEFMKIGDNNYGFKVKGYNRNYELIIDPVVLIYSTYLGGSGWEKGLGIAVDSEGAAYVTGQTKSIDFPTQNSIQGTNAGLGDAFIAKLYFTPSLTITAGSGGTTDPSPDTYTYDEATEVTIRAIPNSGYTFSGWSGDASGTTNPITITMDSDKSITASFAKVPSDDDGGGGGGACFIATACYGTSMAEEVKTLSAFRDRYLITNPTGEAMVKFYKTHSPRVADFIRDKEDLKIIIRACLKPIVWIISKVF